MSQYPILQTKLHIPPIRPELITRSRLIERLNLGLPARGGFARRLTLISAPAGFGKTTLVSEWVHKVGTFGDQPLYVAWLSLDEEDNDPARFLAYLIAALRTIEPRQESVGLIGKGLLSALQSPQPPQAEAVLVSLINDVAAFSDTPEAKQSRIILVLDDHHTIESSSVDDALAFLLERLPPQMHLVIATREDPHLPLARLRARGQLTEIRASDLRFTSSEAAEFLNQAMGLDLSAEDVAALENRTEGWIAGLQLAALALQGTLSLQGHRDATSLIHSFTGSHRYVLDYLVEEVLEQQPESVQDFLLQTAILDRLTGSLCDALTGRDNGRITLEVLERANLFIVPLDDKRHWYRYHHLFADLLRQRLRQDQPERVPRLHIRASNWYEQNGAMDEAIEHALRAQDFERTVYLIESVADTVWARGGYNKLRRWLDALPVELVLSKPKLCIFRAWDIFASGRQDAAEELLQAAGLVYDPGTDPATETGIQAWIAAYRRHDISGLIQHLRKEMEYLSEQDLDWHSAAATTLGDLYAFGGDMPAAYQARLEALKACEAAGNIYLFLYNSAKLALNLKFQGRLRQVREICQQRVQFAGESGMAKTAVVGWLLAIWAEVLAEENDLDSALDLAEKSIELTEHGGDVTMFGWSCLCLTKVLFSRGEMAGAQEIVQKVDNVARESIVPTWIMSLNAAWQSRIWLAQKKLEAAAQWVTDRRLAPDQTPEHLTAFEYIALARIRIAQGRGDETTRLLQQMLEAAKAGENVTRVIEIMSLQALAFQAGGDTSRAMDALQRALDLAEPEGFVRIFVNEGQPMARLLYKALGRGIAPEYAQRLLAAFPLSEPEQTGRSDTQSPESGLIEPLSKRELEVVQLIAQGLTNAEIASRLFLSLHTVKSHARNIYSKLGVRNRTEAVTRARALGVLPPIELPR